MINVNLFLVEFMNELKALKVRSEINPEEIAIYVDWHDKCDAANLYHAHSGLIDGLNYLAKNINKDFFNDNYGRFEVSKIETGSILNILRKKDRASDVAKEKKLDPAVKIITNKLILFFICIITTQGVLNKADWDKIADEFNAILVEEIGLAAAEICRIDSRYLIEKSKHLCKRINFNEKEFDVKLITKARILDVVVMQRISNDYIERIFDEIIESNIMEIPLKIKKPDIQLYGTEQQCEAALQKARWPQGFRCPKCHGQNASTFIRGKTR
ncbi:MAG: hypothetical protein RL571_2287, partial [Pseudomonadota bacterium]